ncbi:MAG: hypothetical protein NVS3B3_18610 [Aquirhabdus sp.]
MNDVTLRWMCRALIAENQLRKLGADMSEDLFTEDDYLVITRQHKDGRTATMEEIKKAANGPSGRFLHD